MGDAAHTAHFSIGSGTKLAMEDAIALARACTRERHGDLAARRSSAYEADARASKCCSCRTRPATPWSGSRTSSATPTCAAGAVRLLPAHPQPAHQPREPAPARPAYVEGVERWFAARDGRRTRAGRAPIAADVHALPPARHDAAEPRRRLADGACTRAPTASPDDFHLVHLGAARIGGAGLVFTEMTCVSRRRAHHAGLRRPVQRRAQARRGSASSTSCTPHADAKIGIQLGHAGRQGLDAARLGRRRRAARRRQLAADRGLAASPYGPRNQVPRAMTRADMDRVQRRLRARGGVGRRGGLRLAGAALRARLSALALHLAAHQPAQRRIRRLAGEPLPLSARGVSPRCARCGRRTSRCRCASRRTTGSHGGIHADDAVEIARAVQGCRRRHDRRLVRPDDARTPSRSTAACTRRRSPTASATRSGIATIAVGAIFEADHVNSIIAAGRADLVRAGAPASRRPVLDAARGRRARLPRHAVAAAIPRRPRPARAQHRARRAAAGKTRGAMATQPRGPTRRRHRRRARHRRGRRRGARRRRGAAHRHGPPPRRARGRGREAAA